MVIQDQATNGSSVIREVNNARSQLNRGMGQGFVTNLGRIKDIFSRSQNETPSLVGGDLLQEFHYSLVLILLEFVEFGRSQKIILVKDLTPPWILDGFYLR